MSTDRYHIYMVEVDVINVTDLEVIIIGYGHALENTATLNRHAMMDITCSAIVQRH